MLAGKLEVVRDVLTIRRTTNDDTSAIDLAHPGVLLIYQLQTTGLGQNVQRVVFS